MDLTEAFWRKMRIAAKWWSARRNQNGTDGRVTLTNEWLAAIPDAELRRFLKNQKPGFRLKM
jgi:hypothetical protein